MVYYVDQDLEGSLAKIEGNAWNGRKMQVGPMASVSNGAGVEDVDKVSLVASADKQLFEKGCWTIGLINSKYKYLSAETFGFRINANGKEVKKKQMWTLEPFGDGDSICLKSHLDKYLAVDQFGNVTCDNGKKDETAKFEISVSDDFSGRWAFKNVEKGYFLGAGPDSLACNAKSPRDTELWYVHLAVKPMVNLRSMGRKRFGRLVKLEDENDVDAFEIQVDDNVPWGEETLLTLQFAEEANKYVIRACNNMYINREGRLVKQVSEDCYFACEYHGGFIALRDNKGQYISPVGSKAVLSSRSYVVTKDELFSLEDAFPQASFMAASNSRYVSVKQGVDLTANQEEISDHEKIQLEQDALTGRWYLRTMQDRYFTLSPGGSIQAMETKRTKNGLFDMIWQRDGSVCFKANNGKFMGTKKSGHLFANCDAIEEKTKYFFYLINRPILVFKCEQGFVDYKSSGSAKLECNKATYERIRVEQGEGGLVYFKGINNKYWHVTEDGISSDSDMPQGFHLELRSPTQMCIKTAVGRYIVCEKNGGFVVGSSDEAKATHWEF